MLSVWTFLNSTWAILAATMFIWLYHWYKRPKLFPPGPRGIPLFGTLPFLGKFPERTLKKWSKTYGPIMSVRFGTKDLIFLNNCESVYQAFVKQSARFSGRPKSLFLEQITEGMGLIFTNYNDLYQAQRKFGSTVLRRLGMGRQSVESKIVEEVSCLNDAVREKEGKPFDIKVLLHNAVSNVIAMISLGKRFDYDDSTFREILYPHSEKFADPVYNFVIMILQVLPFLMKIPPFSTYNRAIVNDLLTSFGFLKEIVAEHKESFDKTELRDFIDFFLLEIENNSNKSFNFRQLIHYVRDLFQAGTDTTANTLYWSLLCLILNPDVQDKMRKEVTDVLGPTGNITMQRRSEMPYTCAVMEEIFRFRTLAPFGVFHCTTEEAALEKYVIPKGTTVVGNFWAIHNDKTVWEKPEIFNPDRFIDDGKFIHSPHVLPFSVGPRHCLGEQLARMEFFIFLVSMVRQFQFTPGANMDDLDVENGVSGTIFSAKPYSLIAKAL